MWELDYKESQRIDAFELYVGEDSWVPWTARRSNQSILKEISPEYSLEAEAEAETPKLWPPDGKSWLIGKDPVPGKDWRQEAKGMTEDEMVGWYHRHDGHEFEQALGDGEGQGSLACGQSMGSQRVGHNWTIELNWYIHTYTMEY